MKEGVEQHLLLVLQKMGLPPEPTLPQEVDSPQDVFKVPPVEFTMMDFLHKKTADTDWDSPPFYTHPQGYKMCLNLEPNGCGEGKGTHISLYAALMKGEHDGSLQWPFEGDIVVELLNWREDKQHVVFNQSFSRLEGNCVIDSTIGSWYGNSQFISHSSLSYNSTTNTEYLQDDCLRLRVKEVAVYSTPLLHKTPSWQDHLNPSQSVCEFTVTEFSKRKQFNNIYYSPPFYTHTRGYKMCLKMYANGYGTGEGTHVTLYACLMEGEHDDDLVWPFRGDVTMELINWRKDNGHHQKTTHFNSTTDPDNKYCCRIYNEVIGVGLGIHQFISHSSLSYNSTTNTEYLQDDCLRLRVKVVVHST